MLLRTKSYHGTVGVFGGRRLVGLLRRIVSCSLDVGGALPRVAAAAFDLAVLPRTGIVDWAVCTLLLGSVGCV